MTILHQTKVQTLKQHLRFTERLTLNVDKKYLVLVDLFQYMCLWQISDHVSCAHLLYLVAKLINYGDVIWLWFVGIGQQDVIGHHLHWVQSELQPLVPDLLCVSQILLCTGQVGESCKFPAEWLLIVSDAANSHRMKKASGKHTITYNNNVLSLTLSDINSERISFTTFLPVCLFCFVHSSVWYRWLMT